MKSNYTKQDLIKMLRKTRFAVLRGLKENATEEEKARAKLLLDGGGEEFYELLESLVDEPDDQDEEELLQLSERLQAAYGNKEE